MVAQIEVEFPQNIAIRPRQTPLKQQLGHGNLLLKSQFKPDVYQVYSNFAYCTVASLPNIVIISFSDTSSKDPSRRQLSRVLSILNIRINSDCEYNLTCRQNRCPEKSLTSLPNWDVQIFTSAQLDFNWG